MSTSPIKVITGLINAQNEIADFIANGPSDGLAGHVRNQYRTRCNQFANLPGWARALGNGSTGTMSRICEPYWDANNWSGPESNVPFTGGQCPGRGYNVTTNVSFGGNPIPIQRSGNGPISLQTQPSPTPGQIEAQVIANGVEILSASGATAVQIVSIVPQDGQPDNCGDPPGELVPGPTPPPNPPATPGPEPTTDPSDPTGPPLLPIAPFDDPLGGPTPIVAPTEDGGGVDPDLIPGNPDSAPGGGENIGEPIMVDPGPGGGGDDLDFGEPPTGKAWIGALLQFAIPASYGIIPGSGPANPVVQRVFGNASLVFQNGRGTAYRVNSGNIDLIRPSGALKVTGVYVNCLPGITYNVRPVSIDLCPENNCS